MSSVYTKADTAKAKPGSKPRKDGSGLRGSWMVGVKDQAYDDAKAASDALAAAEGRGRRGKKRKVEETLEQETKEDQETKEEQEIKDEQEASEADVVVPVAVPKDIETNSETKAALAVDADEEPVQEPKTKKAKLSEPGKFDRMCGYTRRKRSQKRKEDETKETKAKPVINYVERGKWAMQQAKLEEKHREMLKQAEETFKSEWRSDKQKLVEDIKDELQAFYDQNHCKWSWNQCADFRGLISAITGRA